MDVVNLGRQRSDAGSIHHMTKVLDTGRAEDTLLLVKTEASVPKPEKHGFQFVEVLTDRRAGDQDVVQIDEDEG